MAKVRAQRTELEHSLQAALDAGPAALGQQVRAVLALAQTVTPSTAPVAHTFEVVTPAEARLLVLAQSGDTFAESQIDRLVEETRALPASASRMDILLRFARHLPLHKRHALITEVTDAAHSLTEPATRARVLFRLAGLLHASQDEHAVPPSLLPVITAAQAINNAEMRIRSLTAIVQHLPHPVRVRMLLRLFDEIDQLPNDHLRSGAVIALAEILPPEVEVRALRSVESIQSPAERGRTLISLALHLPSALQTRLWVDALASVRSIANVDERAELLIRFAPHLNDAPGKEQLLEKTIVIVNSINRAPLRARALVALAPHLTPNLLDEALSAIHSLADEHDRAALLAELVPTLPKRQAIACVNSARTMRSVDASILALTTVARYVPDDLREQIARDLMGQVESLPHPYERVTALMSLADILPLELQAHTYSVALDNALRIENENARARAISLLGPHLPSALLPRALDAAYQFMTPNLRMSSLSSFVPLLGDEVRREAMRRLLESAQAIQLEYKRARALVSIAPLLTLDLLHEVQAAAEELGDAFDQVIVYIAIAQNLPPDQRPPIISHAWTLVKQIEGGYDSASAIAAIAPFLPDSARSDLHETASSIIASIRDEYDRASAIGILVPLLLTDGQPEAVFVLPDSYLALEEGLSAALDMPNQALRAQLLAESAVEWTAIKYFEQSYRMWRSVALRLAELPLADTLLCLNALLPVLRLLAGEEGVADIAHVLLNR